MSLSKTTEKNENPLSSLSNLELLSLHSEILTQLHARGVIRTQNNPVGDYAEWLVANTLKMKLLNNSSSGADAIDAEGMRVQIKARRVTPENPSRQLSALRNYESGDFDYLVAVIFDKRYCVLDAYKIPHEVIRDYARHHEHVNAHIIIINNAIISDPRVISIKASLQVDPPPPTNRLISDVQSLSGEVVSNAPDKPKKAPDEALIAELLKAIGMSCFVTWYPLFANEGIATADIIEQLHTQEGYTEKSCRSRLTKARKIINDGLSHQALNMIISSERVNDSVRDKARKLLSTVMAEKAL